VAGVRRVAHRVRVPLEAPGDLLDVADQRCTWLTFGVEPQDLVDAVLVDDAPLSVAAGLDDRGPAAVRIRTSHTPGRRSRRLPPPAWRRVGSELLIGPGCPQLRDGLRDEGGTRPTTHGPRRRVPAGQWPGQCCAPVGIRTPNLLIRRALPAWLMPPRRATRRHDNSAKLSGKSGNRPRCRLRSRPGATGSASPVRAGLLSRIWAERELRLRRRCRSHGRSCAPAAPRRPSERAAAGLRRAAP